MFTQIFHIRHRLALAVHAVLFIGLTTTATTANAAASADEPGLFGTREIRSTNLAAFTKWTGMLNRHTERVAETISPNTPDRAAKAAPYDASYTDLCKLYPRLPCSNRTLKALIHDLEQKSRTEQLDQVNRHMNKIRYVTDDVNWGVADYWATPREFFRMDGDCEDFAIAKYVVLKRLGFVAGDMRVVVLEDQNLNTHHAVLVVGDGNTQMILDNQISEVVTATSIHHYKPVYSINEGAWWLHIPIEGSPLLAEKGRKNP